MSHKMAIPICLMLCILLTVKGVLAGCDRNGLANPYGSRPRNTQGNVMNPRTKFVVARIKECLRAKYKCGTYKSDSKTSDHPGNAADCYPGRAGVNATGQIKVNGDTLAQWLTKNARPLKVKYVIWRARIWSLARESEGWRKCKTPEAPTCYNGPDVSKAHFDHVHISVS